MAEPGGHLEPLGKGREELRVHQFMRARLVRRCAGPSGRGPGAARLCCARGARWHRLAARAARCLLARAHMWPLVLANRVVPPFLRR